MKGELPRLGSDVWRVFTCFATCLWHSEVWTLRNEDLMRAVSRRVTGTKCHWIIPCDAFFGTSRILSGTVFLKRHTPESTLPTMYRPVTTGAGCCHILEVFEHLDVHRSFAEKLTPLSLLKSMGRKRRRRFVAGSSWLKCTS